MVLVNASFVDACSRWSVSSGTVVSFSSSLSASSSSVPVWLLARSFSAPLPATLPRLSLKFWSKTAEKNQNSKGFDASCDKDNVSWTDLVQRRSFTCLRQTQENAHCKFVVCLLLRLELPTNRWVYQAKTRPEESGLSCSVKHLGRFDKQPSWRRTQFLCI